MSVVARTDPPELYKYMAVSRPAILTPDKGTIAISFLFLLLVFFTGGGSRADIQSLLILRPMTILVIAAMIFIMTSEDWKRARRPLMLLGALAALIALQLIPLPFSMWSSLPGRELVVESDAAAGLGQIWRPFTLSPAGTWNALMALLIPAGAILVAARLSRFDNWGLLPFFLLMLTLSAMLGFLQVGSSATSPLYMYEVTTEGRAAGFLSNANHHAFLTAAALPILALWSRLKSPYDQLNRVKPGFSAVLALFLMLGVVASGSRGGLVVLVFAVILSIPILRMRIDPRYLSEGKTQARANRFVVLGAIGVAVLAIALILITEPAGIQRIMTADVADDLRWRVLPTILDVLQKYSPWGAGFGSFDRLFRVDEPTEVLSYVFLNHAHNDLLEFLIEGGVFSLTILAVFMIWFARSAWRVWRASAPISLRVAYARLATIICALLLLGSLVDYPLRTPLVMIIFTCAFLWIITADMGRSRRDETKDAR